MHVDESWPGIAGNEGSISVFEAALKLGCSPMSLPSPCLGSLAQHNHISVCFHTTQACLKVRSGRRGGKGELVHTCM